MSYPWRSRAVLFRAPATDQVTRFCHFIRTRLRADRIDTMVLLVRYRFAFISHPECRAEDPLSRADAAAIAEACRESGIHLIPKMNLLGHQSGEHAAALLRAHPELDENGQSPVSYCRTLCPTHPDALPLVLDLVDEMTEAFQCDAFHIGMDEVFELGKCPRCRGRQSADLFADWVNAIARHLKEKEITPYMWGDRLLDDAVCHCGVYESSQNGTAAAIDKIDRSIVVCDWHCRDLSAYPSVEILTKAGFRIYLCIYDNVKIAQKFLDYAAAHDNGGILGIMETTWAMPEHFIDALEGGPITSTPQWITDKASRTVDCYRWMADNARSS